MLNLRVEAASTSNVLLSFIPLFGAAVLGHHGMGIPGLTRWLEGHGCTRQLKDNEVIEGVDYLCLDMNGVCHAAYNIDKPDPNLTMKSIETLVMDFIRRFPPQRGIAVVFDGPAPVAKLPEQRKRRKDTPLPPPNKLCVTCKGKGPYANPAPFNSSMLTTGSSFMLDLEERIFQTVQRYGEEKRLGHVYLSGTRVPGEGETKIVAYWNQLAANRKQREVPRLFPTGDTSDATAAAPGEEMEERIVVISSDSDVAMNAIGCVAFRDFLWVNPYTLFTTVIKELLRAWTQGGSSRWALTPQQLPTARRDFVFLMSLSGGDHYPGVEGMALDLWQRYKKQRHVNHQTPPLLQPDCSVDLELLRTLVLDDRPSTGGGSSRSGSHGSKGKSQPLSPEPGNNLIKAALWCTTAALTGYCPDYQYLFRGDEPKPAHLRAALRSSGQRKTRFQPVPGTIPLFPLEVFIAAVSTVQQLPAAVQRCIQNEGVVHFRRIQSTTSGKYIGECVKEIVKLVPHSEWSAVERSLLEFGEPKWVCISDAPVVPSPIPSGKKISLDAADETRGEDSPGTVIGWSNRENLAIERFEKNSPTQGPPRGFCQVLLWYILDVLAP
jgi:hypothetical protein